MQEIVFKGIGVSPGIAMGPVFLLPEPEEYHPPEWPVRDEELEEEFSRFLRALSEAKQQIQDLHDRVSRQVGGDHAAILDVQLMIVSDEQIIEDIRNALFAKKNNVEAIFHQTLSHYLHILYGSGNQYLAERHADIKDVMTRVLNNLRGKKPADVCEISTPSVVIARDIPPSETARMEREKVLGFAIDAGGQSSHTAIIAKALGIPAVVGLHQVTAAVREGDLVLVDGQQGTVTVHPAVETLERSRTELRRRKAYADGLAGLRSLPATTRDGRRITLSANIEFPAEVQMVVESGAEGVGLYRTEFIYMNRSDLPSEEEQFEAYKAVVEGLSPHPTIIRTMDLGGDKFISHLDIPFEFNPFLGWRAIRFCLERRDIFEVQLRAILRAGAHGPLKLMYPLISCVSEVIQANAIVEEVKQQLRKEGLPHAEDFEIGAMIEVPSAAMTADIIAKEVDFFSIGTNDLIQYTMAVERVNDKIAHLYQPSHPAVLRFVKRIVDEGHRNNIWVGICGEMAADPAMVLLLLGMGIDEISVNPATVPRIKNLIRNVSYEDAAKIVEEVMEHTSAQTIEARAREVVKNVIAEPEVV
ncbi:MAG: phosphoenolpyruvate--protein phosphotransferase [bacterium]|nr:phosphoenolpyruvate--protein phosphotransferase [bacterium]